MVLSTCSNKYITVGVTYTVLWSLWFKTTHLTIPSNYKTRHQWYKSYIFFNINVPLFYSVLKIDFNWRAYFSCWMGGRIAIHTHNWLSKPTVVSRYTMCPYQWLFYYCLSTNVLERTDPIWLMAVISQPKPGFTTYKCYKWQCFIY